MSEENLKSFKSQIKSSIDDAFMEIWEEWEKDIAVSFDGYSKKGGITLLVKAYSDGEDWREVDIEKTLIESLGYRADDEEDIKGLESMAIGFEKLAKICRDKIKGN